MNNNTSADLFIDIFVTGGVPLLFVLVALVLQWPVIKHKWSEYTLSRTIKKFGREIMNDVMLPDSLGGMTYIDYLALTANAIVILYLKRYQGVIFAGEKIDEWTQVINNHSYRFPNPLQKMELDIMAINALVKDIKVDGKVIFTRGSEFPKGKPDSVVLISELEKSLKNYKAEEVPPSLQTAWKRLQEQTEPCSKEFIQTMRENGTVSGHGLLASVLVLSAIAWIAWHLIR